MILKDIGMVAADTPRTAAYIQLLVKNQLIPAHVIVLASLEDKKIPAPEQLSKDAIKNKFSSENYFDPSISLIEFLKTNKISFEIAGTVNINDTNVVDKIKNRKEEYFVYSGIGGLILKNEILSCGKKFLHLHPGHVPDYRGSTTIYYSILNEDECCVSAFFLEKHIDTGALIKIKEYSKPVDGKIIDIIYDPYIRADLLVDIMQEYVKTGKIITRSQPIKNEETYFIIHPVLKHLAVLSCSSYREEKIRHKPFI